MGDPEGAGCSRPGGAGAKGEDREEGPHSRHDVGGGRGEGREGERRSHLGDADGVGEKGEDREEGRSRPGADDGREGGRGEEHRIHRSSVVGYEKGEVPAEEHHNHRSSVAGDEKGEGPGAVRNRHLQRTGYGPSSEEERTEERSRCRRSVAGYGQSLGEVPKEGHSRSGCCCYHKPAVADAADAAASEAAADVEIVLVKAC